MQSETLYNLIKFASFCVTVLLSFGLAAFCCAKLCTKLGEEGEKSMYMSMLTSVVSLWIPSPTSMMTLRMGGGANEPPVQDKRVRRSMKLITDGGIMEEDHVVEMESATVQQKEAKKEEEEDE